MAFALQTQICQDSGATHSTILASVVMLLSAGNGYPWRYQLTTSERRGARRSLERGEAAPNTHQSVGAAAGELR
jgi:hypothetical protein